MTGIATGALPVPQAPDEKFLARVVVTGATGFVGRYVVRELVVRGHQPVCIARDIERLSAQTRDLGAGRVQAVAGGLSDPRALATACEGADAVIHLVGVIFEKPMIGQTFHRVHVEGTQRVVEAAKSAGVRRIVHMSALGARLNAPSEYHRTKAMAEGIVCESGLDYTIFRPSIIHGPDGEFMRMMRTFVCDMMVPSIGFIPTPFPVIPYFGDGQARLQPVSVKDVAQCFVAALSEPATIGKAFDLGGPEAVTWKELYRICRATIPGAKAWKPIVGQPVWAAKLLAATVMKLPILPAILRFNSGQVDMSQEDSVCDSAPVERALGLRLRDFRKELADYAALIE
ncbi:MAG: complex I NDUFA9 subunit family protein [Planctomycetota bacterium]